MKTLLQLAPLGAVIGIFTAGSASAATLGSLPSGFNDAAFNNLLLNGTIGELFVAENRAGNNAIGGEREVGINQPLVPNGQGGLTGGAPFPGAEAQKVWPNGTGVPFTLTYNVTTNTATYTVAGAIPSTLTAITLDQNPSAIYLRTRATGAAPDGTATNLLSNLSLTDGSGSLSIPNLTSTGSPTSDTDYLLITNLTSSFTLTGLQTFSWDPTFPLRSNNASQIKVVYPLVVPPVTPVPEPSSLLSLLSLGGLGLAMKYKKAFIKS